ncbi:MAG: cell division protein ZapE, partial [Pseudomonadota bacterium]
MADGPLYAYRRAVTEGRLTEDAAQRLAVEKLQLLHNRLAGYDPGAPKRVRTGLFGWGREKLTVAPIPGLYLFGGVGRGKSMLMDLFHTTAPVAAKRRVHFHAFMQEIHARIAEARAREAKDPIAEVAAEVAASATLLSFDELQITDITDAMIVGRLFEALFARGVVVVTTSNRPPEDLYKDGLNRKLFLPFIELLRARLEVHHLESPTDHRLRRLAGRPVWFTPLGAAARGALDAAWEELAHGTGEALTLRVSGRDVVIPEFRSGIGRAAFADLC